MDIPGVVYLGENDNSASSPPPNDSLAWSPLQSSDFDLQNVLLDVPEDDTTLHVPIVYTNAVLPAIPSLITDEMPNNIDMDNLLVDSDSVIATGDLAADSTSLCTQLTALNNNNNINNNKSRNDTFGDRPRASEG